MLIGGGVALVGAVAGFAGYAAWAPRKPPAPTAAGGDELAKLADVPENGGIVLRDREIVLCRGAGSEVRGFTAVCTHAGCLVGQVSSTTIDCDCHGSQFSTTTGEAVAGPAKDLGKGGLTPISVTVKGDSIQKG